MPFAWRRAAAALALAAAAGLPATPAAGLPATPCATAPAPATAPTPTPTTAPAESAYIVRFRDGVRAATAAEEAARAGIDVTDTLVHAFPGFVGRLTPEEVEALRADPAVVAVERDTPVTLYETQSTAPWGLDRVDQPALPLTSTYTYAGTGAGVTAYVIDSGIVASHAEFGTRVLPGHTVVDDGLGTFDCRGHGTHVAGTVAGATSGLAKAASIVPVRVFPCLGDATASAVVAAIDWVIADHLDGQPAVAVLSLGGEPSDSIDAAVLSLLADGVPAVVASGNAAPTPSCELSPARVPAALTVAATDDADASADFASGGPCVDLFAPGVSITSAGTLSATAVSIRSGTSMAAAHVAGAAALVLGARPELTPAEVSARILAAATPGAVVGAPSGTPDILLNALAATPLTFADLPPGAAFYADIVWLADEGITRGAVGPDGAIIFGPWDSITREAMAAFVYRFLREPAFEPPATSPFADLAPDAAFYREITYLEAQGIAPGAGDPGGEDAFRPSDEVTREVMALWLFRALADPAYLPPADTPFVDVATTHPAYREIAWMAESGLSTGVPQGDGTFLYAPDDPIRREAMAAFLHRGAGLRP